MNMSELKIQCSYSKVVKTDSLKPYPENPNKHSETQVVMLADLIRTVGWRYPIVVSKRSGYIVSGHARWLAAKRLDLESVPIDFQDYDSENDELLQLLGDNKIPELAQRDINKEAAILERLRGENVNTLLAGYKPKDLEQILKRANLPKLNHEDEMPEMELNPHEHYDYILLLFRKDYDWMKALQVFGIKDMQYGTVKDKKKIDLGRVVDGARILQEFFDEESNSKSRQVGHNNNTQTDSKRNIGGNRRRKKKVRTPKIKII